MVEQPTDREPAEVAVLGATGFVGRAVVAALEERQAVVRRVRAPRLNTSARDLTELRRALEVSAGELARLTADLRGCDVVVNAAGLAAATASGDCLYGADALLPGLVARSAGPDARVLHVSSAAVQGRRPRLDESIQTAPFSDYSRAKALGEELVLAERPDAICLRPTSVQGAGRDVTRTLVRVLSSPIASVAGSTDRPTPQVLVDNVGDAAAFLALCPEQPPSVVLQPGEAMTTGELVRVLGGREPRRVPLPLATALVAAGHAVGRVSSRVAGLTRRVEMMWLGQDQEPGWLADRWTPPVGRRGWEDIS